MAHTPHTAVVSNACSPLNPLISSPPPFTHIIYEKAYKRCVVVTTPSLYPVFSIQPRWYFSLIKFFFASIFSLTHTTTITAAAEEMKKGAGIMRAFSFPFRMCVTKQQPHQPATTTAASIAIISRNFTSKKNMKTPARRARKMC
jgi:hypothetical protein